MRYDMISTRTRRIASTLLLTAVLTSCASYTDTDEDSPPDDTTIETETDDGNTGDDED